MKIHRPHHLLLLLLSLPATAGATLLSESDLHGGISGPGITGTAQWASANPSLSWDITQINGTWHYSYDWTADAKDLSHIILQVTDGTILGTPEQGGNFWNFSYGPDQGVEGVSIDTFAADLQGGSNPLMPYPIYGIKFDLDPSALSFHFEFDSTQSPTWGNFYAKDGVTNHGGGVKEWNVAWNTDENTIVRPNGGDTPPVPEPGTMILFGTGLMLFAGISRKIKI